MRKFTPDRDKGLIDAFADKARQEVVKFAADLIGYAAKEGFVPELEQTRVRYDLVHARNLTKMDEMYLILLYGGASPESEMGFGTYQVEGVAPWGELVLKMGDYYATPSKVLATISWLLKQTQEMVKYPGGPRQWLKAQGLGDMLGGDFGKPQDPADWWKG